MNRSYDRVIMNIDITIDEKERLARKGQMTIVACAIRLRAARYAGNLEQQDLAKLGGVSKSALSNTERGDSFPSRDVMAHLYRAHRIDFNFILNGDFAQLPGDVQDRLFPELARAETERDQKEHKIRSVGHKHSKFN